MLPSGNSRSPGPDRRAGPLKKLLARRHQACRQLGLPVPREISHGPPETLAWRVATLDRWIGRELDRAGGVKLRPIRCAAPPDAPPDVVEEAELPDEDAEVFARRRAGPGRRGSRRRS